MTLKVRNAAKGDKVLNMSNLIPVVDFKNMYISELNDAAVTVDKIRMFHILNDGLRTYREIGLKNSC